MFDSFPESVKFSYLVSKLAQILNHHPTLTIDWNKVKIELYTWALNDNTSNLYTKSAILIYETYESIGSNTTVH
jgi:pterin-4a-carbinolamine dehydratase